MRDRKTTILRAGVLRHSAVAALALCVSTPALALPWNIDMADSAAVKAYEQAMAVLPEGVVSQPNLLTPISFRTNWKLYTPEADALTAESVLGQPFDATAPATLALGQKMYTTYCTPCHGADGVNLGPVAVAAPALGVPALAGADGRLPRFNDGHVYLTIRNGSLSTLMSGYGYAMDNREIWSLIAFVRSETVLKGATYVPPAPAPVVEATP